MIQVRIESNGIIEPIQKNFKSMNAISTEFYSFCYHSKGKKKARGGNVLREEGNRSKWREREREGRLNKIRRIVDVRNRELVGFIRFF